jgi:TrmH family RNA methyltransferase
MPTGGRVVALVPRGGVPLFAADLRRRHRLAAGRRGPGLGDAVLRHADVRVSIPMPGGAESLNVAAAGAIALYERVRQSLSSD